MNAILENPVVVQYVIPAAASAAFALVLKLLYHLQATYATQAKHTIAATVLHKLENLAILVVSDLEQTEVPALKAATATGKLSAEDAAALKQKAIEKIKSYASEDGLKQILKALEIDPSSLESLIGSFVEKAVGAGVGVADSGPKA